MYNRDSDVEQANTDIIESLFYLPVEECLEEFLVQPSKQAHKR